MLKVPHCPDMEPFPWSLQRAFQNSRERISGNGLPAVGGWLLHRITSPIKHRVSANGDGACFISGPPQQAQGGHRDKSTGEAASCTMWRELVSALPQSAKPVAPLASGQRPGLSEKEAQSPLQGEESREDSPTYRRGHEE